MTKIKDVVKSGIRMAKGQAFDEFIQAIDDSVNKLLANEKLSPEDKSNIALLGEGMDESENIFKDAGKDTADFLDNVEDELREEAEKMGANTSDSIDIAEHLMTKYNEILAAWIALRNGKKVVKGDGKRKISGDLWKEAGNAIKDVTELSGGKKLTKKNTTFTDSEYAKTIEMLLPRVKGLEGKYFKEVEALKKEDKKPRKSTATTEKDLKTLVSSFNSDKEHFLGTNGSKQRDNAVKLYKTLIAILYDFGELSKDEKVRREKKFKELRQSTKS